MMSSADPSSYASPSHYGYGEIDDNNEIEFKLETRPKTVNGLEDEAIDDYDEGESPVDKMEVAPSQFSNTTATASRKTGTASSSSTTAATTTTTSKAKKPQSLCEQFLELDHTNAQQMKAIERLGTLEGMTQMQFWIQEAMKLKDTVTPDGNKRLTTLIAQCWHAPVELDLLKNAQVGKIINKIARNSSYGMNCKYAQEVVDKWKAKVEMKERKRTGTATGSNSPPSKVPASSSATAAIRRPAASSATSSAFSSSSGAPNGRIAPASASGDAPAESSTARLKPRIKTARTKDTKFRSLGFDNDDDPAPTTNKKSLVGLPSRPIPLPRSGGAATFASAAVKPRAEVSDAFGAALSSSTASPVVQKPRRPPPLPQLVGASRSGSMSGPSQPSPFLDPLGPDPARIPKPGERKRIHFADDKGLQLVAIKEIPLLVKGNAMAHNAAEDSQMEGKAFLRKVNDEEEDDVVVSAPVVEPVVAEAINPEWVFSPVIKVDMTTYDAHKEQIDYESSGNNLCYFAGDNVCYRSPAEVTPSTSAFTVVAEEITPIPLEELEESDEEDAAEDDQDMEAAATDEEPIETVPQEIQGPRGVENNKENHSDNWTPASPEPEAPITASAPPVATFPTSSNVVVRSGGDVVDVEDADVPVDEVVVVNNVDIHSVGLPTRHTLLPTPRLAPPHSEGSPSLHSGGAAAGSSSGPAVIDPSSLMEKINSRGGLTVLLKNTAAPSQPPAPVPIPTGPGAPNEIVMVPYDIHGGQPPLRPRIPAPFRGGPPMRPPSQTVCSFFLRGACRFGKACCNIHDLSSLPPSGGFNGMRPPAPGSRFGRGGRGRGGDRSTGSLSRSDYSEDYSPRRRRTRSPRRIRSRSRSPAGGSRSPTYNSRRDRRRSPTDRGRTRRYRSPNSQSRSPQRNRSRSPSRSPVQ